MRDQGLEVIKTYPYKNSPLCEKKKKPSPKQDLNPRPTKPFFVTWFTKGGGSTPLMNLKLTGPKYDCLVPWYRVGSPLSIDTKIMKIGQRMTSQ